MERTYSIGSGVSREAIENEVSKAWSDLRSDAGVRDQLAAAGVDLSAVRDVTATDAITVRSAGSGFAGEAIVVALAIKVASDVWEKLILPRLLKRFGADAVVEQKSA